MSRGLISDYNREGINKTWGIKKEHQNVTIYLTSELLQILGNFILHHLLLLHEWSLWWVWADIVSLFQWLPGLFLLVCSSHLIFLTWHSNGWRTTEAAWSVISIRFWTQASHRPSETTISELKKTLRTSLNTENPHPIVPPSLLRVYLNCFTVSVTLWKGIMARCGSVWSNWTVMWNLSINQSMPRCFLGHI